MYLPGPSSNVNATQATCEQSTPELAGGGGGGGGGGVVGSGVGVGVGVGVGLGVVGTSVGVGVGLSVLIGVGEGVGVLSALIAELHAASVSARETAARTLTVCLCDMMTYYFVPCELLAVISVDIGFAEFKTAPLVQAVGGFARGT